MGNAQAENPPRALATVTRGSPDPHPHSEGVTLALCSALAMVIIFETRGPAFLLCIGLHKYIVSPPSGSEASPSGLPALSHQIKGHCWLAVPLTRLLHGSAERWFCPVSLCKAPHRARHSVGPGSRGWVRPAGAGWSEPALLGVLGGTVGAVPNSAFHLETLRCPSGHILTPVLASSPRHSLSG